MPHQISPAISRGVFQRKPPLVSHFTVHQFVDEQQTPFHRHDTLRDGENAIWSAVSNDERWAQTHNGVVSYQPDKPFIENTGQAYYYSLQPPLISWTNFVCTTLKEWGEPASFDEEYSLEELEDFQCGIATAPIFDDPTISSPSNMGTKRGLELLEHERGPSIPSPSPKRLCSGETSLYHLIAKPHTHPTPFVPCPTDMRELPRYWQAQPSYISPYDSERLSHLPDTSRLSWVIPVRGKLPWEGSTPASMYFDAQPPSSADDSNSIQTILWTADSLLQFWDLLLTFQKSGGCGSFGLSFHFARKRNARKPKRTKGLTPRSAQAPSSKDSPPSLATIDYIKVYHDAFARLQLRALFDIFAYNVNENGHKRTTKVLEGARLVLLDNIGRAVLIH